MKAMDPQAWAGILGQKWAQHWRETDRTFSGLTERLIEVAEEQSFSSVLDIGCGAGEMCLLLAQRHANARVLGIDISPQLIDAAQKRLAGADNAEALCADATSWQPHDKSRFDLLLARHVVMFFENPGQDLAHLASLASPGGRLVFSCFRTNDENGWIADILSQVPGAPEPRLGKDEPSPLSFADIDWVGRLLTENGWTNPQFEAFDYPMLMGEGEHAIESALEYLMHIGPASFAAATLKGSALEDFKDRMRGMLQDYHHDDKVTLPAAIWIGTADKG